MKYAILVFSFLACIVASAPTEAAELAGNEILIPVAGRTPGAEGSQWRTDLVVANVSMRQAIRPVTISFHPADGSASQTLEFQLHGRASRIVPDVLAEFGNQVTAGILRVSSVDADARLSARARIYNVGSPLGEFGQSVPGLRVSDLQLRHSIPGLSGVGGNRTNVGISNPHSVQIAFWFNLFDADGEGKTSFGFTSVAPRSVFQINDVFAWAGVEPFEGALVEISTTAPAYVWASVVRGDSGDAIFIPGVAPGSEIGGPVEPNCASPAPIFLADVPAEGWIVILHDDVDAAEAAVHFGQKYGFTIRTLYEHAFKGFSSMDVSHAAIAGLRCESQVKAVEQNASAVP